MFCPRCSTELPDSASICSQCGSPVSATSSLQPWTSTFSYLPAGAPQWPTTASPQAPYPVARTAQAAKASVPVASRDELEPDRPRRKPGSLSIPIVLLLLFASILVGGGLSYGAIVLQHRADSSQQPTRKISLTPAATATPGATTTPGTLSPTPGTLSPTPGTTGDQLPTPLSFQQGVSPDLGISIQYPTGWTQGKTQQDSNGNKGIVFSPSTQLPVTLIIAQFSAANSAQIAGTSDINTANIQGFGSTYNLPSPQILTNTPTTRVVGGATWDEVDAVYTPTSGSPIHLVSLAVKHAVYYYNILFYAATNIYDEAMAKYYTKMLNSFKFTS